MSRTLYVYEERQKCTEIRTCYQHCRTASKINIRKDGTKINTTHGTPRSWWVGLCPPGVRRRPQPGAGPAGGTTEALGRWAGERVHAVLSSLASGCVRTSQGTGHVLSEPTGSLALRTRAGERRPGWTSACLPAAGRPVEGTARGFLQLRWFVR